MAELIGDFITLKVDDQLDLIAWIRESGVGRWMEQSFADDISFFRGRDADLFACSFAAVFTIFLFCSGAALLSTMQKMCHSKVFETCRAFVVWRLVDC